MGRGQESEAVRFVRRPCFIALTVIRGCDHTQPYQRQIPIPRLPGTGWLLPTERTCPFCRNNFCLIRVHQDSYSRHACSYGAGGVYEIPINSRHSMRLPGVL